jgi:hypothetical protein
MREPLHPTPAPAARTAGPKAGRDDRLKAALKANMARRKAQAKARGAEDASETREDEG